MGAIKVKIRVHDADFEAEGSREDVDALLQFWWSKVQDTTAQGDHSAAKPQLKGSSPSGTQSRPKANRSQANKPKENSANGESFDPNQLANTIKQNPNFSIFADKILHQRDRYNKVALICMLADQPLTSGDIHRVLTTLRIKISLPGVSTALANNSTKFLNSTPRKVGGAIPSYELTSAARKELEKVIDAAD